MRTLAWALVMLMGTTRAAHACAFAFESSASPPRVSGEEALIVWDAEPLPAAVQVVERKHVAGPWVTTFEDAPSRRGADDLSFRAAAAQRPIAPAIDAAMR
jgi:hypothetical protein